MKIYIGIDPGSSSGCIAEISSENPNKPFLLRFSKNTNHTIANLFKTVSTAFWENEIEEIRIVLEDVHTFPGQGISSSGKFMHNKGMLEGMLIALSLGYVLVTPAKWMAHFGIKKKKEETKQAFKKRLREKAEQLIGQPLHAEEADAVLMAIYAKENYGNNDL